MMTNPDPAVSGQAFRKLIGSLVVNKPLPEFNDPKLLRSSWEKYSAISDKYYKPGKFTTFIGFEWTSAPQFQNLHRCVIFADKGPAMPYTAFDSVDPEDLWRYLEAQRKQGLDVIAVPHNGNASNGLMFSTRDMSGKPITRDYAERRMANEPLAEIIQAKGQSDTSPALSPTDEFANFEMWLYLIGTDKKAKSATGSYLRQAYGVGQEQQAKLGVNPFKYGIEAGTDFHSGITSTEPSNFPGSHGNQDNDPKTVITATTSVGGEPPTALSSGGLTGVWAEENTRESIFAALKRKETFGTSGTRIKARMFAGWSYPKDMTKQADWVKAAYAGGVPQGGDLTPQAGAAAPTLVVHAIKDPNSGNLDRIQIIKISTKNGKSKENVYDVVWSGDRKPDAKTGKVPAVGNTVDVKTATYHELDRRDRTDRRVDRSLVRSPGIHNLLRPCAGNSYTALVNLLGGQAEPAAEPERRGYHSAASLDIADLVHAGEVIGVAFGMSEVSVAVVPDKQSSVPRSGPESSFALPEALAARASPAFSAAGPRPLRRLLLPTARSRWSRVVEANCRESRRTSADERFLCFAMASSAHAG